MGRPTILDLGTRNQQSAHFVAAELSPGPAYAQRGRRVKIEVNLRRLMIFVLTLIYRRPGRARLLL